jgi:hypothetical protein
VTQEDLCLEGSRGADATLRLPTVCSNAPSLMETRGQNTVSLILNTDAMALVHRYNLEVKCFRLAGLVARAFRGFCVTHSHHGTFLLHKENMCGTEVLLPLRPKTPSPDFLYHASGHRTGSCCLNSPSCCQVLPRCSPAWPLIGRSIAVGTDSWAKGWLRGHVVP